VLPESYTGVARVRRAVAVEPILLEQATFMLLAVRRSQKAKMALKNFDTAPISPQCHSHPFAGLQGKTVRCQCGRFPAFTRPSEGCTLLGNLVVCWFCRFWATRTGAGFVGDLGQKTSEGERDRLLQS